ncbi:MAG: hypothetical protein HC903_24945 [Methylacidiphilales bacterium]|nr:hypothetical protein [Candidatus Methylacidiphilales bacterium]
MEKDKDSLFQAPRFISGVFFFTFIFLLFTWLTVASDEQQEFKFYLDRLTTMIPGEVISLYLVGNGFIPTENGIVQIIWAIFCLVAVVMIRSYGSSDPKNGLKPQWETVILSAICLRH